MRDDLYLIFKNALDHELDNCIIDKPETGFWTHFFHLFIISNFLLIKVF
jgi:hypothetical protein